MTARVWLRIAAGFVVFLALLFGAAGTFAWFGAWAFLILFFGGSTVITALLARQNPALLEERMKPPIQKDQPIWDRVLVIAILAVFLLWFVLMGVDHRFGWSHVPVALQWIGALGIIAAIAMWHLIMRANAFLAAVVKIQKAHKVVSTGPYAIVRHPLYSSAALFFTASALLLGSWWGLLGVAVVMAPLVVRTAFEDRELQEHLDGYREYAQRVRWRLVPLVW
jgi:protein-S-isoprenylcysteine O-methyltransferase Ste14